MVARFPSVASDGREAFTAEARAALEVLAARPGFVRGSLGRAADDPGCHVLVTEWVGVGAWRRALSGYDVKMTAAPLLALAEDAPSAFEVLAETVGVAVVERVSDRAPDADDVGPSRDRGGMQHPS